MGNLKDNWRVCSSGLRSYHHRQARRSDGAARTLAQVKNSGVLDGFRGSQNLSRPHSINLHQSPSISMKWIDSPVSILINLYSTILPMFRLFQVHHEE